MHNEIAKQNSDIESNTEYYKKKVNKYEHELLQLHYKNLNFRNKNYQNDQREMSELKSSSNNLETTSEERNLLIQAPKDIEDRRKLRTANIEVIESELFYDPEDNFGEKYKNCLLYTSPSPRD